MASSLIQVLQQWYEKKDATDWVLCTIFATEGSSYRKAGAMMMFSGIGQQHGLLSGGCLESDMLRHARDVMLSQRSKTLTYDANDEDDLTFQLGIGCGGVVHILLQPVQADNGYLGLESLFHTLTQRQSGIYKQSFAANSSQPSSDHTPFGEFTATANLLPQKAQLTRIKDTQYIEINILPEPHLLIAGGGYDARPLAIMAKSLGWTVSVWDPRPANAKRHFFADVDHILRDDADSLHDFCREHYVTAAVLMAHSVSLDANVLRVISKFLLSQTSQKLDYVGLLGPSHRKRQVLQQAGVIESDLPLTLAGPIGLELGGDTPESIALAILAEIHAVKQGKSARSLSGIVAI